MHKLRIVFATAVTASLLASSAAYADPGRGGHQTDGTTTRSDVDTARAIVQLALAPVTTATKTKPAPGKKVDFNNRATKSYRAVLSAQRNDFKRWLRANAPKVKVTGEFDLTLNAVAVKLNGTPLTTLRRAPMATDVQYEGIYYPTDDQPDLTQINAYDAWTRVGGEENAGAGVKVGVIDSGIDATHSCFDDTGYPKQTQRGNPKLTNNKVIVAKVFNMKAKSRGYTAEAIDSHGTHVAGTVACNYETPVAMPPYEIPFALSGVAPAALLGNYNVFPGDVADARSEDILNALDAAYADGMDVMNMSLGGPFAGFQDLLTKAVDNLDMANVVVAVSAGNDGPGHYTVGSPGSAARALTAGATDTGMGTATSFTLDDVAYDAVPGDFGIPDSDLPAPVAILTSGTVNAVSGYSEVCTSADAALVGDLTGRIAILGRGTCDFSTKIRYVEKAGAVGAIVVDRVRDSVPFIMGTGESPDGVQPTIPAYMISANDGIDIRETTPSLDGESGTMGVPVYEYDADRADSQADFSSQGPTDVDFRVKPDVMAPGANVLSSIPSAYCTDDPCFAFFSGTSMASPHLAGTAAVVRGYHSDWSAEQVRSAIVNTAQQGVVTKFNALGTPETDVNIVGAGLEDVDAALGAQAALGPVSVSFGAVPAGSGQTRKAAVTVTNLSKTEKTFALATGTGSGGVAFSVTPDSVVLASSESATVMVTMKAEKRAEQGDHQAFLRVSSEGDEVAHAAVYTFVK
jgi:subtilisin family serine protease